MRREARPFTVENRQGQKRSLYFRDDVAMQHASDPMIMRAEEALFGARLAKPHIAASDDERTPSRRILESVTPVVAPALRLEVDPPYAPLETAWEDRPAPLASVKRRPGRPPKSHTAKPFVPVEAIVTVMEPAPVATVAAPIEPASVPESAPRKTNASRHKEGRLKLGERWKRNLRWVR